MGGYQENNDLLKTVYSLVPLIRRLRRLSHKVFSASTVLIYII